MEPWNLLKAETQKIGISLTQSQVEKFEQYAVMLRQWNEKMNLTAITDPKEIVVKHFLDSLWLLHYLPIQQQCKMIDVGTGAGFPGVPLAITVPGLQPTLMDSLQKRLHFLQELCGVLKLPASFVHQRAEDGGQKNEFREKFDVATARAVAALPVLCEYCMPFVKKKGMFVAWKGPDGPNELEKSKTAIQKLGGEVHRVFTYTLCDGSSRSLIIIQKVKECPRQYPRNAAKIKKEPL